MVFKKREGEENLFEIKLTGITLTGTVFQTLTDFTCFSSLNRFNRGLCLLVEGHFIYKRIRYILQGASKTIWTRIIPGTILSLNYYLQIEKKKILNSNLLFDEEDTLRGNGFYLIIPSLRE